MREAAVQLLDAATVSNPPHCRRKTQPTPMSAKAEKQPTTETLTVSQSALVRFSQPETAQAHYSNKAAATPRLLSVPQIILQLL